MSRRSLSNLLGGSLLVATVAALNACGGEAAGGETTPSAGTTGTPTTSAAGTTGNTGTAGKSATTPSNTGTAGAKPPGGTMTSGVTTAAGKSGGAGSTASAAAGSTGAAGGGTSAAAGSTAAAAGATGGAAGGAAAAAGSTGGGMLGGPLKYTGMFTMGMSIDPKYKCPMDFSGGTGENKSPALSWMGGPADTKSFAVVLYDTQYNMLHWAIWDIPATASELSEGLPSGYELTSPMGAHQAANMGMDKHAYYGPCSGGAAAGTYEYRLYAMKTDKLGLMESTTATAAQTAIEGMMLEKAVWAGKPM